MQTLSVPFELKADGGDTGKFTGYGAVFNNVDLGQDVILEGSFEKVRTTSDGRLRLALYHDLRQLVGNAKYEMDEHGLRIEGQMNMDVSYARDAYYLMKDGSLDGMSVGFDILKGGVDWREGEEGESVRVISKAELWEVSIVPFGMNPDALIDSVKSNVNTLREFEHFLTKNGYSRREAKAIASGGYGALQRDAGGSLKASGTLAGELKDAIASFNIN